ncbi:MAG: hypothetical protein RL685_6638 [Pseudomonadota bacterium]
MKSAKSVLGTRWLMCLLALAAGCSSADAGPDVSDDPRSTETASVESQDDAALLSQELVAPGRTPINPCAAVLCAAPSTCEVVDGQGVCVALDSCARVRCPGGTSCEVVDGNAECLPDPDPNPCAAVSCLAPSTCELVRGEPACVPVEESNPCAAVSCLAPSRCEVIDGQGVCISLDACASVRCRAGTHCEVVGDRAVCEPDEATNPCAAVLCPAPSTCEVVGGAAVCRPIDEPNPCAAVSCLAPSTCEVIDGQGVCVPVGPFCGGFAGFACPGSGLCVDAPGDGCDPDNGGADCGGVCTCPILALCIEGLVFNDSPDVCACVPAGEGGECRE